MDNSKLVNAIQALKKEFGNEIIPKAYWDRGDTIIIRTEEDGSKGCIYYEVTGSKVIGTNPLRANLTPVGMKKVPRSLR